MGYLFPELGELFPELGELFPELGELFPELREMHTRLHTPRHILSPVILRYNTMYVLVIKFDRAQFLTETRANIVDVQLCMDFVKSVTTSGTTPMKIDGAPTWGRDPQIWNRCCIMS